MKARIRGLRDALRPSINLTCRLFLASCRNPLGALSIWSGAIKALHSAISCSPRPCDAGSSR